METTTHQKTTIEVDLLPEVMDWLTNRAIAEKCSIEDFCTIILNAVCINSKLNQQHNETKI